MDLQFHQVWMVIGTLYVIMDVIHKQVEMVCDWFQPCKLFNMKITLWTSVRFNRSNFHEPIWLIKFQKPR